MPLHGSLPAGAPEKPGRPRRASTLKRRKRSTPLLAASHDCQIPGSGRLRFDAMWSISNEDQGN